MPLTTFHKAENVGVRRVGEEIFILAPEGDLIVLGNETAVFLWEAVEAGAETARDLVVRLDEGYEVSHERAASDVDHFLGTLTARGVLLANVK
ncbi:MAG: PqqD family protein [Pseudomonadota bacterium]